MGSRLAVLLACLLAAMPMNARADDAPEVVLQALGKVVAALRDEDSETLAAMVDWPGRTAEGRFRGTQLQDWDSLDGMNRMVLVEDTIDGWLDDHGSFLRSASLYDFRGVDDPDAGNGPVPDRVVVQGVLRSVRHAEHRDVLLYARPDGRVLDLLLGEPYPEGTNPAGPEGLLPAPAPGEDGLAVYWPGDVDRHARDAARELVETLCVADSKRDRALAAESLHRSPQAGVAALLERLVQLEEQSAPDAALQSVIVETLQEITGRSTGFLANPRYGMDEGAWHAANHAEVVAWVRWHGRHGGSFAAAPVVDPLAPTHAERPAPPPRGTPGDSGRTSGSAPRTTGATDPSGGDLPRTSGATAPTGSAPTPPPPGGAPVGDTPSGPRVSLRDPPPPPPPAVESPADDLPLLGVPPEGAGPAERHPLGEVKDRLGGPLVAAIESWAPTIRELGLTAAASGHPAHLVLGRLTDEQFVQACHLLDAAYPILAPVLPGTQAGPVVVILLDREDTRGDAWRTLIDTLSARDVIRAEAVEDLRRDPRGFTARSRGVAVQPIWDLTGEGEFSFENELVHKFAQMLAVERTGPLPEWLLWGLGHLLEIRMFSTAYQFSTDGFVASVDHLDWPRATANALDKRAKRRNFSLADRVIEASTASNSLENPRIAWGTIEYLYARRPNDLTALFDDLAQLQRVADPGATSPAYVGDPVRTRAALEWRLASVEVDALIAYLKDMR